MMLYVIDKIYLDVDIIEMYFSLLFSLSLLLSSFLLIIQYFQCCLFAFEHPKLEDAFPAVRSVKNDFGLLI